MDGLGRGDLDALAGPGVAAEPRLALADLEGAEAAQLHLLPALQSAPERAEKPGRVDDRLLDHALAGEQIRMAEDRAYDWLHRVSVRVQRRELGSR